MQRLSVCVRFMFMYTVFFKIANLKIYVAQIYLYPLMYKSTYYWYIELKFQIPLS